MGGVTITVGNGNLGRASQVLDGVCALIGSGVAVSNKFALGDVLAFTSLADAENKGINEAYDIANKSLLWHHIRDFYANAGEGTELYVMPVANTVTMTEMIDADGTHAPVLLESLKGRVRMIAISCVPASTTYITEFDEDVFNAGALAMGLYNQQFNKHRPIHIFIEGRGFQGTAADALDLRNASTGLNANRLSIIIGADNVVSKKFTEALEYAAVCVAMGRAASIPVQRNIGRVKSGMLAIKGTAGLSSGDDLSQFTENDLNVLDAKGYIFFNTLDGHSGYYANDDHCACKISDDYAYIHRTRPIDKAARILYETYLEELKDDVDVDPTSGKLAPSVVKHFQRTAERAIQINMKDEISGVEVFVDPDQNILATDKITVVLRIVPKGMVNAIEVKLSYSNPSSI